MQGIVDTYFSEVGAWNAGEPVPDEVLAQLLAAARSGQELVFAFAQGLWGPRGGEHGFYSGYAHTATLELRGGEVVIGNTIMATDLRLRALMGGEVTATWPAARLDELRQLQGGEAPELALCGTLGCLSAANLDEHGLDIDHPLGGADASDPAAARSACPRARCRGRRFASAWTAPRATRTPASLRAARFGSPPTSTCPG